MRAHRTLILSLILALALAVPAAAAARRLIIGGSTSVLPLAQKLASRLPQGLPEDPRAEVEGGQSDIGISGVAEGRFDIGDSSRDPIEGVDPHGLVFTKIARDGVCVITNNSNPIANLSQETVEGIFTGASATGAKSPARKISGPIDLFDRDGASGTQDAFQHIFLGENAEDLAERDGQRPPTASSRTRVGRDKQAIGFVSFAFTGGVNPVGYKGIACNLRNAKSGQYLGVRNFWMVTKGAPERRSAEVHQMGDERQQDRRKRSSTRAGSRSTEQRGRRRTAQDCDRIAGAAARSARRADARRARRRVLLLIALMVVTVVINAWPSFSANGSAGSAPAGTSITQLRAMREGTPLPGHSHPVLPRLAADLGDDPDDRACGRVRAGRLDARGDLPDRIRARAACAASSSPSCACSPACLGDLRADRDPAIAPWINENLISNGAQAVGHLRRAAQRHEPDDGDVDPDGDDPADHGRADRQRAGSVPASWREGSAALGRQPLAHDLARVAAHRAAGNRRRDGARDRTRARRGDHARDGRRRQRRSRPTRSTA